jgi:hypothetical protein
MTIDGCRFDSERLCRDLQASSRKLRALSSNNRIRSPKRYTDIEYGIIADRMFLFGKVPRIVCSYAQLGELSYWATRKINIDLCIYVVHPSTNLVSVFISESRNFTRPEVNCPAMPASKLPFSIYPGSHVGPNGFFFFPLHYS